MAGRTQIVCLHEGEKDRSIGAVFINQLLKSLRPAWIRPWGSNIVRTIACGGRKQLIKEMPAQLRVCLSWGGHTTLIVWADVDDDKADGNALKQEFWLEAEKQGVQRDEFDTVVFIFAKDRLENWVEFLTTGKTDEEKEGPRVENREAAASAVRLAEMCQKSTGDRLPPSLQWSCKNWKALVKRMQRL